MDLNDLAGLVPAGFRVDLVERKSIIDGKIKKRETIEIVGNDHTFPFSTIDDACAGLLLASALSGKIAPPASNAERENAAEDAALEDDVAPAGDDEAPPELTDDAAPPPPPAPPPRQVAPGGPIQSQFASRGGQHGAKRSADRSRVQLASTAILDRV